MGTDSFADYLSTLDTTALAGVLAARPDVLVEPAPRGFVQLAQRLGGPGSLSAALRELNRDALLVGQAVAALGRSATVPGVARLLGSDERRVRAGVAELTGYGLSWVARDHLYLPERLADHWSAEFGGGRPIAELARSVRVEDLRAAAAALDVATDGMRKADLVAALSEAMADPRTLAAVLTGLPVPARLRLDELRHGTFGIMFGFVDRRTTDPTAVLSAAGLVLHPNRQPEVPKEVAVAAWLTESDTGLTGRPAITAAHVSAGEVRPTARAAAREAVRAVSTLLDEARATPISALKKGGVGPRARTRLAKRLSMPDDELVLWIDLAHAAGLLDETDAGYAPTDTYDGWRAATPSAQWAALATAWHGLEHAPLNRELDDDREHPPPLPLMSAGGMIRRALLAAAGAGGSLRAAGREIDWFCPLHGYPSEQRDAKVRAAVREAELLGLVADDRHTELGEHLLAGADGLADRCAPLLSETPCEVILQSDLTAVVSGQPNATVARLLAETAVPETRGGAGVWRFTPASVRAALDAGRTAADLLAELAATSSRAVPQPLEYLVQDAARRHGQVRVRGVRSCVVADEVLATEIEHTRSLAKLRLTRLAPTVLTSPYEVKDVLERLRAAGLSPVTEDASGTVVVESRTEHRAERVTEPPPTRPRVDPAELATRLVEHPVEDLAVSPTVDLLAGLNRRLDDAELTLLADAIDHRTDIVIAYRDKNGTHTIRQIRPNQVVGRWLDAWCHLRSDDREFTIANIETVAPAT